MMDVTDRKQAERMKSDFVSFVSHQLRTPLSGMNWMLEVAAQSPGLPSEASEYIAGARESAARLVTLVNDLLDISRLESGRLQPVIAPVSVGALTRAIVDETQPLVRDKGHHVEVATADDRAIDADEQLLRPWATCCRTRSSTRLPAGTFASRSHRTTVSCGGL